MQRYNEEKEIINFYQGLIKDKIEEDYIWGLWDSHVDMVDRRSKFPNRHLSYTLYKYGRMFYTKLDDRRKNMVRNLITIKSDEHFRYACLYNHTILSGCINTYGRQYVDNNRSKFILNDTELSIVEQTILSRVYLKLADNNVDCGHIFCKRNIELYFSRRELKLPVEKKSEVVEFNNNK